ncbi:MAG: tRNA pseudouridine(38-40) synthase TruA [Phycisphaerales bacterium]
MLRCKLTIAYDGTAFHGWQKQEPPGSEPLRTVQGVVEQAVREVVRAPVDLVGASRTDAGVHARGQVAAFTSAEISVPLERLPLAINSRLPDDVQITNATFVPESFNPISECTRKCYHFSIAHGRSLKPLFDRQFVYFTYHTLDVPAMHAAARLLIGTHDFSSFAQINHGRDSTVRTIFDCSVTAPAEDRCTISVIGDGFLYNMVRIIAGTLVEVGRGRLSADSMGSILVAHDRRAAGPTLPPQGLCLMWIEYEEPHQGFPVDAL